MTTTKIIVFSDGDGTISSSELGSVMRSLGMEPTERDLQRLMRAVDTDGSGVIEFQEFLDLMSETNEVWQSPFYEDFDLNVEITYLSD